MAVVCTDALALGQLMAHDVVWQRRILRLAPALLVRMACDGGGSPNG